MKKLKTRLLAISGVKNSGKTTLIEGVLPFLNAAGLQVAVIKHDGHDFTPDAPGTDSFRFFEAGAYGTAVFDGNKFSLTQRCQTSESILMNMFPNAELILLEGFKHSRYPKIELIRKGVSEDTVCDPQTRIAIVSDFDFPMYGPVFRPDNLEGIAKLILQYTKGSSRLTYNEIKHYTRNLRRHDQAI